jgi:glycerate-2-kinase
MAEENSTDPTSEDLEMYQLNVCAGWTQARVGEKFGICGRAVSNHVRKVAEWLRYAKREEVVSLRSGLTERLEWLYRESVRAWERSQEPEKVTTIKTVGGETVTTVRETPQAGTPAFIKLAVEAIGGIQDLWASEMSTADRRGESRSVGKTQAERIDQKIEELQRAKAKLAARQNGGGAGDRA